MNVVLPHSFSNRLLARLTDADRDFLAPHLEAVDLPVRKPLENRNRRIDHVYFIDSGFASVVANGNGDRSIEVGLIGREGMTGLAVVMATDRTPHETFMQVGGTGRRIAADLVRQGMERSGDIHRAFLQYAHAFVIQASYTAMANGRGKIEERLARWLLMARDRLDGDEMELTHEFLSLMLGVRRPGVTITLGLLEGQGLIRVKRGRISVIDREGLEQTSNGLYGKPEAEFQRLFG